MNLTPQTPGEWLFTAQANVRMVRDEAGDAYVEFTPIVLEAESPDYGGWSEILDRNAFDETDFSDVRGLWNHNPDWVFGRTTSGTMTFRREGDSFVARVKWPKSALFAGFAENIERGDVTGASFRFYAGENDYMITREDGKTQYRLKRARKVDDFSIVTYPFYPQTEGSAGFRAIQRSLQQEQQAAEAAEETPEPHTDPALTDEEIDAAFDAAVLLAE